jgi:hypothetical protein
LEADNIHAARVDHGVRRCVDFVNVDEVVLIDHSILGSVVVGTFKCRKSETNSRELDVEIHYSVKLDEQTSPSETIVQMYKVR